MNLDGSSDGGQFVCGGIVWNWGYPASDVVEWRVVMCCPLYHAIYCCNVGHLLCLVFYQCLTLRIR